MSHRSGSSVGSDVPTGNSTRRQVLRKSTLLGASGVIGIGGFSSSAVALHCDNPEDDSEYEREESSAQSQADKNIELVSGTDVAHIGSTSMSGRIAHIFYFVTNAVTQYEYSEDPVNAVDTHEVRLDSSNIASSNIDFCQSATGIYPGGDHEAAEKFATIANLALEAMAYLTDHGTPLPGVEVFQDNYWDDFDGTQNQSFGLTRNFSPEHETKVQGMFEITHDKDDAGRAILESETRGYRPTAGDPATPKTMEDYWIYCSDDFVTIDTEPPGSP